MKRNFKFIALLLLVTMLIPGYSVMAYSPRYEYEAQMLYDLGLFKGTDNGFELGGICDRLQGATMFVRLLGQENDAVNNPKSHPFNDVNGNWASPYVGQMYAKGYTKGSSANQYGTGKMTANQFATFCLRAINYKDGVDFTVDTALKKMLDLYIINEEAYKLIANDTNFYRDYAAKLAYSTLFADINGTEKEYKQFNGKITYPLATRDILIMNLIRANVIDKEVFENSTLRIYDNLYFYTSKESADQLTLEFEKAEKVLLYFKYENRDLKTFLEVPTILPRYMNMMGNEATYGDDYIGSFYRDFGNIKKYRIKYSDIYRCSKYIKNPGSIELTKAEKEIIDYTQKNFLDVYIKEGMSDYDKILAAYEFTMDSITYGYSGSLNSSIYMALFEHQGICDNYADLLLYLLTILDFEAYSIGGMTNKAAHAWNKVKLGNDYYNLDATWDDDNYTEGKPYDYFLVSDEYISRNHIRWTSYFDSINEKIKATNTQYDPKLEF